MKSSSRRVSVHKAGYGARVVALVYYTKLVTAKSKRWNKSFSRPFHSLLNGSYLATRRNNSRRKLKHSKYRIMFGYDSR